MKIIEADLYWDGGTVFVDIEDQGLVTRLQLDYSLPWDGRPRHLSITQGSNTRILPIGSKEETEACLGVRRPLEREYGDNALRECLEHEHPQKVARNRRGCESL